MTGTLNMFLWYTRCYHAISLLVLNMFLWYTRCYHAIPLWSMVCAVLCQIKPFFSHSGPSGAIGSKHRV